MRSSDHKRNTESERLQGEKRHRRTERKREAGGLTKRQREIERKRKSGTL